MRPDSPYEKVPSHWKPGFGFSVPDHMLTPDEVASAAQLARELAGPLASWYRCQHLAEMAPRVLDRVQQADLLREAFAAADETQEPNRIVTVASWPLRALLDIGETEWFARELERLIDIILPEPNPFRRQDGLHALLFVGAPRPCFDRVLALFREACTGKQKTLTMRRVAVYASWADHAAAIKIAMLIRDPRKRRKALREIGEHELADQPHVATPPLLPGHP